MMQSREMFINYDLKLNAFLNDEFLTSQLCCESSVL